MEEKWLQIDWVSPPSETPDKFGNHWYTVVINGEKVKTLAQNPPEKGWVWGKIERKTSKAGNAYYRLYRKQVPEGEAPPEQTKSVSSVASESSEVLRLLREIHEAVVSKDETKEEVEGGTEEDTEDVDLSDIPF